MPASTRVIQTANLSGAAQSLTDLGFTAAQIANATQCWVTGRGGDTSYTLNGDTPTATLGHNFIDGTTYEVKEFAAMQVIKVSANVDITVELETYV